MYMKKLVISFLLLFAVFNAIAQESFFRGNNNYVAPTIVLPTISTSAITNINRYGAISGGTIIDNGGAPILSSGICWSATSNLPTITDNKTTDGLFSLGTFASSITGLTAGVAYKVRAYATNTAGTSYGSVQSFTTTPILIQTAVLIGTQVWTDKNLNVANYRNGDPITYAANATEWNAATNAGIGAWSYYNFDATNGLIFGKLYNWFAVNDSRGLAPAGYHIPTKIEYNTLSTNSGSALKAASSEWGASMGTNSTGFAGLPGGNNNITGSNRFEDKGTSGWFWTSDYDVSNPLKAYFRLLHISAGFVDVGSYSKTYGFSVRLVKDNNIIETAATTPVLASTTAATSITSSSAILGGNVTDEGLTQVISRGLVYGTSAGSSTFSVTIGSGAGTFTTTLTGLTQGTRYYVRSFATNVQGTGYGAETSFTTQTTATVSATASVTSITGTTATSGGTITTDGGATITSRGLVWGTSAGASTFSVTTGTGTGTYTASITGLSIATTYFVRAFATNSVGTVFGPEVQFATPNTATVASTITSTITSSTAILGGVLTSNGGATTTIGIMYSTASNFGTFSTTSINANAVAGTYTTSISGLSELTTYYVKAYATNTAGTVYGPTINFITPVLPLTVGTTYQGGIIFYLFQSGDPGYVAGQTHGLIASTSDQAIYTDWKNNGGFTNIATGTGIGTGLANTNAIISIHGSSASYAAGFARAYNGGGYTDWYLPSRDELYKMHLNIGQGANNIAQLLRETYWSSSQSDSMQAYYMFAQSGSIQTVWKDWGKAVRAIRTF